jgi:cell fate (sporulation/competence/biofilm development) regulator YlbF (YheA/YmcA/DUF963 family)
VRGVSPSTATDYIAVQLKKELMPTDTQTILDAAEKLSQLVADHPAVARYKSAQKAVGDDPEAGRMLADFDRQIETLGRQEQQGVPVSEAQRQQLEVLQSRIISHIKIKNLNMAQVEFIDLLRKVNQTIQRPLTDTAAGTPAAPPRA